MRDSCGKNPGNIPGRLRTVNVAVAIRQELKRDLPPALRLVHDSAKEAARKVGNTPRAVEAHRQDEELPRLDVGLAYARLYPHVRELFIRLMDAETGDSGENPAKVINEFIQWQRQREQGRGTP